VGGRLAAGIVIDTATADDAIQDAWVAALLHPPRHGRNLRSWLAFLVRNAVRQGARGESRRRLREREVARTEFVTAAADAVERAEMHRRLVEAVLKLPEPGRGVIVLAYYDELAPARSRVSSTCPHRRCGVTSDADSSDCVGTEGRGRERSRLSGLATLAWGRRKHADLASTVTGGGILMSLKTKLVIAATVLALFGAWLWTRVGPGTAPSEVKEHAGRSRTGGSPVFRLRFQVPPRGSLRADGGPEHAQTTVAPGAVLVSVVRELDHSPVAGVGVQILRRVTSGIRTSTAKRTSAALYDSMDCVQGPLESLPTEAAR
jgi:hypothetical protein